MATSYTFSDTLVDPSDGAQVGETVTATLVDRNHRPVVGLTDTGTVVAAKSTTTNGSGVFSLTLFANASITPANTYYSVRLGDRAPALIEVTANGDVQDLLADEPNALEAVGSGADDQTAAEVPFTPTGNIAATNVQTALAELDTEKSGTSHNHDATYQPLDSDLTAIAALTTTSFGRAVLALADAAAARTAFGVVIGTDVQAYSAVLAATTASFTTADETKLDGVEALADVTDATNVDAAGAVMNADTSTAAMSFVVDEDAMTSDSATKVPTQQSTKAYVDAHVNDSSAAHAASAVAFTPAGNVAATNVQTAIAELDTEKSSTSHDHSGVYQPLDSDLTAIAALTTTTFGRSLLEAANAAALRTLAGLVIGTDVQAYSSVLAGTTASFTTADETKLDGIETAADVTDAANVDAAGAVMNADTSTAGMSFVIDQDAMTSNLDTKVPTQQSVKAYVDALGAAFYATIKDEDDMVSNSASHIPTQQSTKAYVDAHTGDSSAAHAASAIAFTPNGSIAATDVQAAIQEVRDEAGSATSLASLTDVTITSVTDNEVVAYDSGTSKYINQTAAEAGLATTGHDHSGTYQPLDADLTALAAANNSTVLAATTASFLTADETKLDGIEALADVTDAANVDAAGAVMNADTSTASMSFVVDEDNMVSDSATKVPTQQSTKAYVDATVPTTEAIQDLVGAMFSGNTETGIAATYEDTDGTIDLVVAAGSDTDAIHDNVSGEISAITAKTTPVAADLVLIEDSAASNAKKKLQISNLVNYGRANGDAAVALDGVYFPAGPTATGPIDLGTTGYSEIEWQKDGPMVHCWYQFYMDTDYDVGAALFLRIPEAELPYEPRANPLTNPTRVSAFGYIYRNETSGGAANGYYQFATPIIGNLMGLGKDVYFTEAANATGLSTAGTLLGAGAITDFAKSALLCQFSYPTDE